MLQATTNTTNVKATALAITFLVGIIFEADLLSIVLALQLPHGIVIGIGLRPFAPLALSFAFPPISLCALIFALLALPAAIWLPSCIALVAPEGRGLRCHWWWTMNVGRVRSNEEKLPEFRVGPSFLHGNGNVQSFIDHPLDGLLPVLSLIGEDDRPAWLDVGAAFAWDTKAPDPVTAKVASETLPKTQ